MPGAPGQTRSEVIVAELVGWRDRRGRFMAASPAARHSLRLWLRQGGRLLVRLAKEESPTGKAPRLAAERFKNRWAFSMRDTERGAEGTLVNEAAHAPYVIWPTRAHEIRPRHARLLRFAVGNRVVYARRVRHPGTRGNDIGGRLITLAGAELGSMLQRVAGTVRSDVREAFDHGRT